MGFPLRLPVAPAAGSYALGLSCLIAGALAIGRAAWTPELSTLDDSTVGHEAPAAVEPPVSPLPERLSGTGLYVRGSTSEVHPQALFYVPQYPLWTDGATKRRWVLPPHGAVIDASNPDVWQFPAGTRFFKEFSFGARTETRLTERLPDGSYRYATYVWDETRGDAFLAPAAGATSVASIAPGVTHDAPSQADCRACHEGSGSPILGFGALQLSWDRDPLAPHAEPVPPEAVDLGDLIERGLIEGLPDRLEKEPPRIAAPTPVARAAAGYLFGNCSGCHNAEGPLSDIGLDLDQSVVDDDSYGRMRASVLTATTQFSLPGEPTSQRARPGDPDRSAVAYRMGSRSPAAQMPPLGTKLVDVEGSRLIEQWIEGHLF